jgi:hypothetical protein
MDTDNPQKTERRITSLDEHIIKYDFAQMRREAQSEFDASLSTRELIDQDSIARIFNQTKDDERN